MDVMGTFFTENTPKAWQTWRQMNVVIKCISVRVMFGKPTTVYSHLLVRIIAIDTDILSKTARPVLIFFFDFSSLSTYFRARNPDVAITVVNITLICTFKFCWIKRQNYGRISQDNNTSSTRLGNFWLVWTAWTFKKSTIIKSRVYCIAVKEKRPGGNSNSGFQNLVFLLSRLLIFSSWHFFWQHHHRGHLW